MIRVIFTLDYEIHGNGDGCPRRLMVDPTARLLRLFDEYGAKLTIMADVAEILRFKEYKEKVGRDDYYYEAIVEQLRHALCTGHDVQLHLHSSYFGARHKQGRWHQDWSEYNFAGLPYDRMVWMVRTGKDFLENLLRPVDLGYRCIVFRAANWSVSPSKNVVNALVENGILIDTSVFKGGRREGTVTFDYTGAYHYMKPWSANPDDICGHDADSRLWEFPIYTESRHILDFLSVNRLYRAFLSRLHRVPTTLSGQDKTSQNGNKLKLPPFFREQPWKADFNQCSGRQLIGALQRAEKQTSLAEEVPFVLIGHSKLFNSWNKVSLQPFLQFVTEHKEGFTFETFPRFSQQIEKSGLKTAAGA